VYFKAPGLSDYISNTRLEIFETGLQWMHRTLAPAHGFVAVSGQSRGGELVLLLGSMFPDLVSAVVAYVPGAVVHLRAERLRSRRLAGRGRPGCTGVSPLWMCGKATARPAGAPWDSGPEPRRHANALLTALDDADAVARARIPVEKIRGPVMCLSATDDGSWPSSLYSRMVTRRLAETEHPLAGAAPGL
jgi:fermentation-respiration switch protein FrsA (DUF1100 family)